jgi:hypothetical protein
MLGEYGLGELALGEFEGSPPAASRTLIWPFQVATSNTDLRFGDPATLDASAAYGTDAKGLLFSGNATEQEESFQWLESGATAIDEATVYCTFRLRWIEGAFAIRRRLFGGNICCTLAVATDGDLTIEGATTEAVATLTTNVWYRIDFKAVENGTCEVSVDEGTPVSVSAETTAAALDCFNFSSDSGVDYTINVAHLLISTAAFAPTNYYQETLRVNANGTNQTGWDDGSGTGYQPIDDDEPDGDTTYLEADVTANDASYDHVAIAGNVDTVEYVQVVAAARQTGGANSLQVYLGSGAEIISSGTALTTSYAYYGVGSATDTGSGAWDESEANAVEVGITEPGTDGTARVTALWVDVMYVLVPSIEAATYAVQWLGSLLGITSAFSATAAASKQASAHAPSSSALGSVVAAAHQTQATATSAVLSATQAPAVSVAANPAASSALTAAVAPVPSVSAPAAQSAALAASISPAPSATSSPATSATLASTTSPAAAVAQGSAAAALTSTTTPAQSAHTGRAQAAEFNAAQHAAQATHQSPALSSLLTVTLSPAVSVYTGLTIAGSISIDATTYPAQWLFETFATVSALTSTQAPVQQASRVVPISAAFETTAHRALQQFHALATATALTVQVAPAVTATRHPGASTALSSSAYPSPIAQAAPSASATLAASAHLAAAVSGPSALSSTLTVSVSPAQQIRSPLAIETRLFIDALTYAAQDVGAPLALAALLSSTVAAAQAGVIRAAASASLSVTVTPALQQWFPRAVVGELIEVALATEVFESRLFVRGETVFFKFTPSLAVDAVQITLNPETAAPQGVDCVVGSHGVGDADTWYGHVVVDSLGIWTWTAVATIGADEHTIDHSRRSKPLRVVEAPDS